MAVHLSVSLGDSGDDRVEESVTLENVLRRHPGAKRKLEELFLHFLSLEETHKLLGEAVQDLLNGLSVDRHHGLSLSPRGKGAFPPHVPALSLGHSGGHMSHLSPPKSPTRHARDISLDGALSPSAQLGGGGGLTNLPSPSSSSSPMSVSGVLSRSPKRKIDAQLHGSADAPDHFSPNKHRREAPPLPSPAAKDPSGPKRMRRRADLPAFYVPREGGRGRGRPIAADALELRMRDIGAMFDPQESSGGLRVNDFVHVTKVLCGFPSFFNVPLFERILSFRSGGGGAAEGEQRIPKELFCRFWRSEIEPFDLMDRFFRLVKQPGASGIRRDDFLPYMRELLRFHPGLEFLENSEFQEKYAITVVTRIFYGVNASRTGEISQRELRRSNVVEAFLTVDEQEDINAVKAYFSYEDFYCLYCRFWELDTNRDMKISEEELMKYSDHSLSAPIVARIFEVGERPFPAEAAAKDGARPWTQPQAGLLTYEDFIYFMISEEDKGSEASLRYWFKCCDLDEDKRLTPGEMRFFYEVQAHRMDCLGHDPIGFEDILCQLCDMIKPEEAGAVTMADLLKPDTVRTGGALFDVLFNLNKFFLFEQRDPFSERQKREDSFECDWERFAFYDYQSLAAEEDEAAHDGELMEVGDWVD